MTISNNQNIKASVMGWVRDLFSPSLQSRLVTRAETEKRGKRIGNSAVALPSEGSTLNWKSE